MDKKPDLAAPPADLIDASIMRGTFRLPASVYESILGEMRSADRLFYAPKSTVALISESEFRERLRGFVSRVPGVAAHIDDARERAARYDISGRLAAGQAEAVEKQKRRLGYRGDKP